MEKGCKTLVAMMGALYAGRYYVPVDPDVPEMRMAHILDVLDRPVVIVDATSGALPPWAEWYKNIVDISELVSQPVDAEALDVARASVLENDPAYVLFTSGSTGVPKGVVISHRGIVSFIGAFVNALGVRETDRIGNQAPFDFDVSTKDIYSAFAMGATLVIVPRALFMQPAALMEYLQTKQVTVLIWAVTALCIVSSYHAFAQGSLAELRIVAFSGEVMPYKHLQEWRSNLPSASFFNLYGPTEVTCNCLYQRLDESRAYDDGIPLGTSFSHCEVLVVDDRGRRVNEPHVEGELVVRGPSLALGYLDAPEENRRAFTQNPLHDRYPDRVYRTGDLASFSDTGELYFRGRKDNQIKHMGHRIELEEIDHVLERMPRVKRCRCAYDGRRKRLLAFYEGAASEHDVRGYVADSLPVHMRPATVCRVASFPLNKNGKVDRAQLLESVCHV
jgi:amino acid adenylation domain-containing protein